MITEKKVIDTVKDLCIKANLKLRPDVKKALITSLGKEKSEKAKFVLKALIENFKIAEKEKIPICQDTGMAVIFVELGTKLRLNFDISKAINHGVIEGYKEGFLRKSIVSDPILRKNTKNNAPASIYYDLVYNSLLKLTVFPKGFGSENKSKLFMLNPTASKEDIICCVLNAIKEAGPDACPPYVLGIGIGGDASKAALLAKLALTKNIGFIENKPWIKAIAKEILKKGNTLNIGPLGVKGKSTLLGVNILTAPTHIAGLPLAVNISCHALRSKTAVLK